MSRRSLNPVRRVLAWKDYIQSAILDHQKAVQDLQTECRDLQIQLRELSQLHRNSVSEIYRAFLYLIRKADPELTLFRRGDRFLYARRGDTVLLLRNNLEVADIAALAGFAARDFVDAIVSGKVRHVLLKTFDSDGQIESSKDVSWLIEIVRGMPEVAHTAFEVHRQPSASTPVSAFNSDGGAAARGKAYDAAMKLLAVEPDLIDFVAEGFASQTLPPEAPKHWVIAPFDNRDGLPAFLPAEPRRHSAVFVHNNYYHFNWLSKALQKRGWDTMTVSIEAPDSKQQQFYHGEDLNLYDTDPAVMRLRAGEFFRSIPERFGALHFYGMGGGTLFPENIEAGAFNTKVPWDMLELRRHRVIIGYMVSGCMDGGLQSSIRKITGGLCGKCVWENNPLVCSDAKNAAWISKLDAICDWVALEGDWTTPERKGPKFVTRPIITTLSDEEWRPDLAVPDDMKIERQPGELLVYHAVGNYETRRSDGQDIKGTGAVLAAIDQLKREGEPVKLFFATDIPSNKVRFYQVQADIVVDQLNYGRLGANARESLMLGRPLITSLNPAQDPPLRYVEDVPAVHATEETIYEVLKSLLADPVRRAELSSAGRDFAIKWHSPGVCAKRYEMVIDRLRAGLPAEADEVFE